MVVNLDYENASLTARESVVYTNTTSIDLTSVVFNVTPAHFKAFTLNGATVDGKNVSPTLDDVVLEVPLPAILPQGQAVTIDLDFRVNVPKRGGRFGAGDGIIALGNWFPIVAVYSDSRLVSNERVAGWSRHKYIEVGDAFFTETSDFEVTVNTSSPVTIAHTGTLVAKEANRWRIQATAVRDFALAISNRYQSQSKTVDGVLITAYYLPENAKGGQQYLDAAVQAMVLLDQLVMSYPYPTLDLAEVSSQSSIAQGQEYPNLVFISSTLNDEGGGIDSYLAYVVMHEVTHQWFYGLVGNDQIYQPWMDEAMATWFPYHFLRLTAPKLLPNVWQARLLNPLVESIKRNGDSPVNKGVYDFPDEFHYYNIVYRKGALFIEDLYKAMGDAAFFAAMKDYSTTFRDKIATPVAFWGIFQSHTSENLNPLITKFFAYPPIKAGEPLRLTIEFPPEPWSGTVNPKIDANYPISDTKLFIEDRTVWTGGKVSDAAIDTTKLKNGESYLLTVKLTTPSQVTERSHRFGVLNQAAREPTPALVGSTPGTGSPVTPVPQEDAGNGYLVLASNTGFLVAVVVAGVLALLLGIAYAVRRTG